MEARSVEHWRDVIEVRDVLDRYGVGIDQRAWDLVAECFAPSCDLDYGRSGSWSERDPFMSWMEDVHRDIGASLHRITNHQVQIDGDAATATSYFDAVLEVQHRGFDLLHTIGTYTDRLVRTEGQWQITARRTVNLMWRREHQHSAPGS